MASSYSHIRCPGCDGTLRYKKEKKVWECIYCGNEIRREEQYDGLYTIKNVVKQVLADLAYGRMENAEKNLVECEKISSTYVGTLLAEICVRVFRLITPGACQQSEMRGIFGQVKVLYSKLNDIDSGISSEEEALYEAFEENGDAFGVLLLVFDTLQAKAHLDFVAGIFDPGTVYSPSLNANLLNYALKNDKAEMIDKIFGNSDNINCREAVFLLLKNYQDKDKKRQFIQTMCRKAEFQPEDGRKAEEYLQSTEDSVETKILFYQMAVKYHIVPSMRVVMETLVRKDISLEQTKQIFEAFCDTAPKDAELYEVIGELYSVCDGTKARAAMAVLGERGLFIKVPLQILRTVVARKDINVEDKEELLSVSGLEKMDPKTKDGVLSEILLHLEDTTDNRMKLLQILLSQVETISTNAMTEYILRCNIDGEEKPTVVQELLKLNLNMSYFRDTLNQYLQSSGDSASVKQAISQLLGNSGVAADGSVLLDMAIKANPGNAMEVLGFMQKAVQNGSRIDGSFLSRYLEQVRPDCYSDEIIQFLGVPGARVSDRALANYILYYHGNYNAKMALGRMLSERNAKPFGSSECSINHIGVPITCNLFQAYVLISEDPAPIVSALTNVMRNSHAKLNAVMQVQGQSVKFKKYILDRKSQISQMTMALCEENKVFTMFF